MYYKKMYLSLFNSITDSLNALESLNFGQAADISGRRRATARSYTLRMRRSL